MNIIFLSLNVFFIGNKDFPKEQLCYKYKLQIIDRLLFCIVDSRIYVKFYLAYHSYKFKI